MHFIYANLINKPTREVIVSKTMDVKVGDILAIPTIKNDISGYLLARVIRGIQGVTLMEFFDQFYDDFVINKTELENKEFTKDDRLFPPIKLILLFEDKKGADKWKVVANSKTLDVEQASQGRISLMYSYKTDGRYLDGDIEKKDPPESRNRIAEEEMFWQVGQALFRIRFYMNGTLQKGDVFPIKIYGDYYNHRRDEFELIFKQNFENAKLVAEKIKII